MSIQLSDNETKKLDCHVACAPRNDGNRHPELADCELRAELDGKMAKPLQTSNVDPLNASNQAVLGSQMQVRGTLRRNNKTLTRISKFTLFTKKFFPLPEVEGKCTFTLVEVLITLGLIPNLFGHDMFLFYVDSNDRLTSYKMSKLYTEEELKEVPNGMEDVAGAPCSIKSKQQGNCTGCTYYAIINQNPDDPTKGYWESLPR